MSFTTLSTLCKHFTSSMIRATGCN